MPHRRRGSIITLASRPCRLNGGRPPSIAFDAFDPASRSGRGAHWFEQGDPIPEDEQASWVAAVESSAGDLLQMEYARASTSADQNDFQEREREEIALRLQWRDARCIDNSSRPRSQSGRRATAQYLGRQRHGASSDSLGLHPALPVVALGTAVSVITRGLPVRFEFPNRRYPAASGHDRHGAIDELERIAAIKPARKTT